MSSPTAFLRILAACAFMMLAACGSNGDDPVQCTLGDVRCEGDAVVTCVDLGDGAQWSAPVVCPADLGICANGLCTATCTDECTTGQRNCIDTVNEAVCGQFDSDACLEWSPPTPCTGTAVCQNGACAENCTDDCAAGASRCDGLSVQTCGQSDGDTCLEWSPTTACPLGQACEGTQCVERVRVWSERTPATKPSPRADFAMAYDAARAEVVLFGGMTTSVGSNSETWIWNGSTWALRSTTGPTARDHVAMAYDAARAEVVLFGGGSVEVGIGFADTWVWNGTNWTQRNVVGPSARTGHAMVYDAARAEIVLFGGLDSIYQGDTWVWNGSAWTQRNVPGPRPRQRHTMAYDAARGEVVLFGGYDYTFLTSVLLNDTWVWNGTAWTQRSSTTATIPAPRIAHGMTYDALRGEVVMFGGYDSDPLNDTWVWNGATWTIHAGAGPTARSGHAMAYDAARAELVLFGGRNNGEKNDTWRWH